MSSIPNEVITLEEEYSRVTSELGSSYGNFDLTQTLVERCDWTPEGANTVVTLAKEYGTFILRNALALALALKIEDGTSGL